VVRNHLIPAFGSKRLDQVGPMAVETFISGLTERRAPKTVRNIHGVLHNVMKMAVREKLIASNPCDGTRLPEATRRKVMACLTEQQLDALIRATPEWWRPLVVTLAGTGLRWGEAAGLKVRYVDLLSRELSVRETLNPLATRWGTPKSKAGRRTLGLPDAVVDALLPLVAGKAGEEPVFTTEDGQLVKHRWFMLNVWEPTMRAAGLVTVPEAHDGKPHRPTPHDLRHTHAALLIADGVPLSAIKDRLGHESITTTDKTYGYLLPRVEEGLLRGLNRVFGGPALRTETPTGLPTDAENPLWRCITAGQRGCDSVGDTGLEHL
jgi:integrase